MFNKIIVNEAVTMTKEHTIIRDGLGKERLIKDSAEFRNDIAKDIEERFLGFYKTTKTPIEEVRIGVFRNFDSFGFTVRYNFKLNNKDIIGEVFIDDISITREALSDCLKKIESNIVSSVSEFIIGKVINEKDFLKTVKM